MILYDYLPSQNAYKVRLLAHQLTIELSVKLVSIFEQEGQQATFLQRNPMGAVPVLELHDGRTLAESNAILTYLADGTRFLPSDRFARAKINQWLNFEADYVQSGIASLRHWRLTSKDQKRSKQEIDGKIATATRSLEALDRSLRHATFLVNNQYSIADIAVFAYVHLSDEAGISLKPYSHVRHWIDHIKQQPRYLSTVHPYSIEPHSSKEL